MITLTDSAVIKATELILIEGEEFALRVGVRPGGCSGFSYEMFFDSERFDEDISLQYGELTVITDPSSSMLLSEAVLDYNDGLQGGFVIKNPAAHRTCGCGQSFS